MASAFFRKFAAVAVPLGGAVSAAVYQTNVQRGPATAAASGEHHDVLVVGGGAGGITVAAQLQRKFDKGKDICIVEPNDKHFYQPLWTLVGGGQFKARDSTRPQKDVIPKGVAWEQDSVTKFNPEANTVELASGKTVSYDYLVVSAGLAVNFDGIPGLKDSVGKPGSGVCSIYGFDQAEKVFDAIESTTEGETFFTVPSTPIKCGGAPQKIMYLAEDWWRAQGRRDKVNVTFTPSGPSMFPIKHYGDALNELRQTKGINALFQHELVKIDSQSKVATFKTPNGEVSKKYAMLHVVPPMGPPQFIKESPLANAAGYVDVDKFTLQHNKYKNVFALGDCSSLPTSKTAAAITSEAPVLVHNLVAIAQGKPLSASYDGYTSCPIVTGSNKLMLAEFSGPGYGGVIMESFPWDQRVPTTTLFYLKKHFFPWAYWSQMLHGTWFGRHHFLPPEY